MLKSIEISGKTEDEAIEAALEQLGLTRDDVSVEILEQAKSGFLGLKSTPALVKVIYEESENRTDKVKSFITGLLQRMDVQADMEITDSEDSIKVVLTGKEPGALIGRRGETLDAIQHLTNYVVNRGSAGRVRINLDAENYRQRRNETLESLASRTAGKVLKYRRNMTLEPMNAYERHIIHSALQEHESVSTYSVGSEPNRRVVVVYGKSGDSGARDYSHTGGSRSGGFRNSRARDNRSSETTRSSQGNSFENDASAASESSQTNYREWR